jgi:hypothetical protein
MTGNIIQDCQTGRHQFPQAPELQREGLVELFHCRNVTLSSCQILESAPCGIRLDQCSEISLLGLTISDRREPPLLKIGIHWTGLAPHSLISACRILGCLETAVSAPITPQNNPAP